MSVPSRGSNKGCTLKTSVICVLTIIMFHFQQLLQLQANAHACCHCHRHRSTSESDPETENGGSLFDDGAPRGYELVLVHAVSIFKFKTKFKG